MPEVTPWITIRESEAENLMKTGQLLLPEKDKYLVENKSVQLEFCHVKNRFSASFVGLKLQKGIPRKRSDLSGTEISSRPKATKKCSVKTRASSTPPKGKIRTGPAGRGTKRTSNSRTVTSPTCVTPILKKCQWKNYA